MPRTRLEWGGVLLCLWFFFFYKIKVIHVNFLHHSWEIQAFRAGPNFSPFWWCHIFKNPVSALTHSDVWTLTLWALGNPTQRSESLAMSRRPIFNGYLVRLRVCLGVMITERIEWGKIHLFKIERLLLFNRVWPRVSVSAWLDGWTVRWGGLIARLGLFRWPLLGGYYIGTLVRYEQIVRVHQKFTVPNIYRPPRNDAPTKTTKPPVPYERLGLQGRRYSQAPRLWHGS
jgi:hypothetical protein